MPISYVAKLIALDTDSERAIRRLILTMIRAAIRWPIALTAVHRHGGERDA
jgi:hypothetical protein